MRTLLLACVPVLTLTTGTAWSKDRPVTDDEKVKLVAAVTAQGCSGGKMEFDDDGHYEVDEVTCNDGRKYDLKFDTAFKLINKKLDD
jgi:hypothetical protein